MAKGKKIKISACYIVKNNSAELKVSLLSLKNFVNEIIVVDTGSTDDSVKVAKSFGAKVFHKEWQDDFATPRNFALKKASGDWIIFLDADEFFSEETAKNIPAIVERAEQVKQNAILVYLVNIDKDDGNKIQGTDYVVRIMKKKSELRYVGKIHEELRLGDRILFGVVKAPPELLTIYHTGYSTSLNRAKAERNLKMLLAELSETSEPQRIYCYIAECYNGLGDFDNAIKFAELDIESDSQKKITSYRLLLSILAKEKNLLGERIKFSARAVEDFPKLPEFTAELAESYSAIGDYPKAVQTMNSALEKFKNYNDSEPTQFSEALAKFAERRIEYWKELIIENNYPSFDEKISSRQIWCKDYILMEETDEKN